MAPKETIRPLVDEFNSENLPLQHQLDASVLYNVHPKKNGNWKGVIGLSSIISIIKEISTAGILY